MEDKIEWWKGLGEELQADIEITIDDNQILIFIINYQQLSVIEKN